MHWPADSIKHALLKCSRQRKDYDYHHCHLRSPFRYIPTARIQYEYPGHYQASDSQSCASDSNLLLHDDPDHYDDPYADPYEDKSDSQQGRCPAEEAELQNREAAAAAADADSPAEEAESHLRGTEASCQNENAQNEGQSTQQE